MDGWMDYSVQLGLEWPPRRNFLVEVKICRVKSWKVEIMFGSRHFFFVVG